MKDNTVSQNITIGDIAKAAKVSKMTVSRVLSGKGQVAEKTRKRVEELVQKMGYQPNLVARSLSSRKAMTIGVIVHKREHMFMFEYMTNILSGIMDVAVQNNYRVMLCPVSVEKEAYSGEYLSLIRSQLVDGLILLKRKVDDVHIHELEESGFPFVMLNYKKYAPQISFVDSRNIEGARMAVEYLYQKGHCNIAFVRGRIGESNSRDRFKGYKDTLKKLGIPFRREYVIEGEYDRDIAYKESAKLLTLPKRPTAIFCADDNMAIGVINQLKENDIQIPQDIAVVGFDDIHLASVISPSLTTIRQPIYEIGKIGTEVLLDLINGEQKKAIHKLLDVQLIERDSA